MTIPWSHRPFFFLTLSVRPWYGHWWTGSKTWLKKMTWSVRQWYGHWRVNVWMKYEYDQYRYSNTRMEYGIVRIIHLPRATQEWLLEDAKLGTSKRQSFEDGRLHQWISLSNSNTTALHSVCTMRHKNGHNEIFSKLNHNIHNWLFYEIFKNFTILGIFTSIFLSWDTFKGCEICVDLKKILERW